MKSYKADNFSKVQYHTIASDRAGQRIDNYLIGLLKIPKSRIYNLLRKGEIRVNKKRCKPNYRFQQKDEIRLPPIQQIPSKSQLKPSKKCQERVLSQILYEDSGLIVLNKPAGLAVHGGSGLSFGVIEILRAACKESKHLELVHRLDKETSGCLLIAKKRSILRQLHEQFRTQTIEKNYWALVEGRFNQAKKIDLPLRRDILSSGERMVKVDTQFGKSAITQVKPLTVFKQYSLLSLFPKTGRTHQLRVHMQALGHPICGDRKYDSHSQNLTSKLTQKRLFLHAHSVRLNLKNKDAPLVVEAPLDSIFSNVLQSLQKQG